MNLLDWFALLILLLIIIALLLVLSQGEPQTNITGGGDPTIIRPIKLKDFDALLRIVQDKEVMQNIGKGKIWDEDKLRNYITAAIKDWKENKNPRDYIAFTIIDENDYPIGIVQWKLVNQKYMTRIFVAKDHQGKGVGTLALKQSIQYIQNQGLQYKSFIAEVHEHNQASEKTLLKVGFKYKGTKQLGAFKLKLFEYNKRHDDE
jgi:RimJ/RimL family protein N-acetyltransferase